MPPTTISHAQYGPRILREQRTVTAMIQIYCHDQHGTSSELCAECSAIHSYAMMRLSRCPFQDGKTTCAKCTVHCYKPQMREHIRRIMRYAGPRMVWRHPVMAVQHLLDARRNEAMIGAKTQQT